MNQITIPEIQSEKDWNQANRTLVAKAIGELYYEQILKPVRKNSVCKSSYHTSAQDFTPPVAHDYTLVLRSGRTYEFKAWLSVWDYLRVSPESILCFDEKNNTVPVGAAQFFIDAQAELNLTDIILANFLEELHSTLYSDMILLQKNKTQTALQLAEMNGLELQKFLNGHPKILLNKGRMGWGQNDLASYSPESTKPFQLFWIAIAKNKTVTGISADPFEEATAENQTKAEIQSQFHPEHGTEAQLQQIWLSSLGGYDLQKFRESLTDLQKNFEDFYLLPLHPWQWDRVISIQYAGDIAARHIVPLGVAGDFYQPQISLRTLSNVTRPKQFDLKLPLSILNTSAVRGIPERYIAGSSIVAQKISELCQQDPVLQKAKTQVLQEKLGLSYRQQDFAQVHAAPYRYHETLGAIWRQSCESKLDAGEIAVLTGSLFHQDLHGKSLIGAYIQKSGLSISQWLRKYFEAVVIPLYHLQLKYGLGLVAHGQNITLKLKNFVPNGILLKDFQGDLRLSREAENETLAHLKPFLDSLPEHYLIHDLITGHFVTVLRFISAVLQESDSFPESRFYPILSETISDYLNTHSEINHSETTPSKSSPLKINTQPKEQAFFALKPHLNLLSEKTQRILLNKVRFQIGYADRTERPLPLLGDDLSNPLYIMKNKLPQAIG